VSFSIKDVARTIIEKEHPFPLANHTLVLRVRATAVLEADIAAHDRNLFRKVDYALRKLREAGDIAPAPKQQGWVLTRRRLEELGWPTPAGDD